MHRGTRGIFENDRRRKQQSAYVIVYRFDRFTRNRYDSVIYKKRVGKLRRARHFDMRKRWDGRRSDHT